MNQKPDKTEENPKKPVETEEIRLTKRSEKPKVNCGTVLRTRMNIEEHASGQRMFFSSGLHVGKASGPRDFLF